MKYRFYCLLSILLIGQSCKEKPTEKAALNTADIAQLEAKNNASNDVAAKNALLTAYATYASENPDDVENNSRYLRRSAIIYSNQGEYIKAAGTTVLALKKYYESNATEANLASLVSYYERLENSDAAETTMNGYLMAYPQGSKANDYTATLGERKQNLSERLTVLANEIVTPTEDGTPGINEISVNKYIGVAEIYALTNHARDTLASESLFKAGKLAMTIGDTEKAMECYQWIYTFIQASKEAPSALFTHAFTLDNQLGRKGEAKSLYEDFLAQYPKHHFADDAQFQLANLGKNDAQIIEEFNKKANSK